MEGGYSKKSQFRKKHCSPTKKRLPYSCLSKKLLLLFAKAINSIGDETIIIKGKSNKYIYNRISHIMKHSFNCKSEACWLNIRKIMNQLSPKDVALFKEYFRPQMPDDIVDDYTKWISNYNIQDVLNQHHEHSPGVYSYGAVPIDFKNCSVSSDLCKIDLKKHMDNKDHKLVVVFNTDDSRGPGQHWNAMYVDVLGKNLNSQPGIYFFDSFASKPMKQVTDLIDTIKDQGSKLKTEFIVSINDKPFQKNNFSCGFYCMHFLENMISGIPFSKYLNSGLSDKKMIEYRTHCYLHPKEIKY